MYALPHPLTLAVSLSRFDPPDSHLVVGVLPGNVVVVLSKIIPIVPDKVSAIERRSVLSQGTGIHGSRKCIR